MLFFQQTIKIYYSITHGKTNIQTKMQVIRDYIALATLIRLLVPFILSAFSFERDEGVSVDDPEYDKKRSDWMFNKICRPPAFRRTTPSVHEIRICEQVYAAYTNMVRMICTHVAEVRAGHDESPIVETFARIFIEIQLESRPAMRRHFESMPHQSHRIRKRFNAINDDAHFNWSTGTGGFDTPLVEFKADSSLIQSFESQVAALRAMNQRYLDEEASY